MAALSDGEDEAVPMDSLLERLEHGVMLTFGLKHLPPLFRNQEEYAAFNRRHAQAKVQRGDLATYAGKCYLGIDAGSTTTKVALIGERVNYCTATTRAIPAARLRRRARRCAS